MSFPRYPKYKASGVEWLGEVPEHWVRTSLKHIANYQNGYPFKPDERGDVGLPILRIAQLTGDERPALFDGELPDRVRVRTGDLLFSWSANIDAFIWGGDGAWLNQHIFKVTPFVGTHRKFLFYVIKHVAPKLADFDAHGSTMRHIKKESLGEPVYAPLLPEQTAIAEFLDRETGKIDELVAEQRRLMELLKEKRQAVISHAVTKGINPHAPMKPSGIEWLGDVPEHWEVVSLRTLAKMIQTGPFGSQLHSEDYVENGTPVINPSNIQDGKIEPDWSCSITAENANRLSQHKLIEGDIVFGRRGEMGRCALVSAHEVGWICGTGSLNVRLLPQAFPPFISIYLRTKYVREWLKLESVGSTMDNLNTQILGSIKLPSPDLSEQTAIVAYLETELAKFDTLTAEAQRTIDLLQERRTALISAAVAGQIDVRQQNRN